MNNITPLFAGRAPTQVTFDRYELNHIMNLYGRMVAAGLWRDYAVDMNREEAVFSAFRRASERPEVRVVKRPELRVRQGQYILLGEAGAVLRRGHELPPLLAPLERKLLKLVDV
ncbi:DUF2794 domain-containing protein [Sphingosinicella soli]|uniref:DUF2794 domain-containing protein n=1 Tax=Sphingosinicella soli TaxID=333708 RepID=A0A7W7F732_9SPHN|nr:DUF2794 domain-containing protein [Sphingosinicella soli]MBB4632991.1 hypothetical protein [Sphingosinicella soli]